ncbi:MAG: hypothetical protein LBM99_01275 [Bacillales bacterium]|jgi:kojibiose phosphorylase/nigerose phosphorylase|nr:hypothetical protein [Bacillales bacterium]
MNEYKVRSFNYQEDRIFNGNKFLIGNGLYGLRGTLDEFTKKDNVGLLASGVYDQHGKKIREPLNLFNPFYTTVYLNNKKIKYEDAKEFLLELDLETATLKRVSVFDDLIITSKRFVSSVHSHTLGRRYVIKALKDLNITLKSGIDLDIYELNGPHYLIKKRLKDGSVYKAVGVTNEEKTITLDLIQKPSSVDTIRDIKEPLKLLKEFNVFLSKGEEFVLDSFVSIFIGEKMPSDNQEVKELEKRGFDSLYQEHCYTFKKRFQNALIETDNLEINFNLAYAVYQLLILENKELTTSISARGISGQTYKGAVFWDTEIFMLPFYLLTNPSFAKNLIEYRLKTLKGALDKAKKYGYKGAFYAWESQEFGQDACSLYNVSDAVSGKPIRTYFADKQIHISGDIAYAIANYLKFTNDYSILFKGGLKVLLEISNFYLSYAQKENGVYHLNDVLGPDEYHERVNDNAFTNYLAKYTVEITLNYLKSFAHLLGLQYDSLALQDFIDNIYLPKPNKEGVIEQFQGYFALEDVSIEQLKTRLKHPNEYWGRVASSTKIIKQADVVTLLVLFPDLFSEGIKRANFAYYFPLTEHGSSLSSSMYGLLAIELGDLDYGLQMFFKSSQADLDPKQKLWAGKVYIGGSHPASAGGAYKCLVFGFMGLKVSNGQVIFEPKLPFGTTFMQFNFYFLGKKYNLSIINNKVDVQELKEGAL